jgi:pimeloyl-ACP methyl ester carboxylesterase
MEALVTLVVRTPDGHRLTVESCGDPVGMPVFLLHGTPGSHSGPRPRASVLYRLGVRLISYDRPGYGGSDRRQTRTVADAARDVLVIADTLGIDRFGVVGRSGGGPHALACAALLPSRVRCVAVLVGLAPSDAADLDWYDGMTRSNLEEYAKADADPEAVTARLTERAEQIRDDPESMLRSLLPELTGPDRRIVADVAIRRQLTNTYVEAFRDGAYGWIDDVMAFRRPWGFDLSDIAAPVLLWHGAEDVFNPAEHTRWLARQIRNAEVDVRVQPGAAHFDAVKILPGVLAWMRDVYGSERLRVEGTHQPALPA